MSALFFFQLVLTFLVGSVWILFSLLASQHLGSKMGGFIGGLPSTALLSFFFIGYTQSPRLAAEATTPFPVAMGITSMFLVLFAITGPLGFGKAMGISISGWFLLSAIVVWINPQNFIFIIAVYTAILITSYIILEKILKIVSKPKAKRGESIWQTVYKSIFGGGIITTAVFLAKIGGPSIGGIFAAFPAMFISTLTLTYKSHGMEFARSMTKSLMVTGMLTIVIYAVGVRYFYPMCGLGRGTLISVMLSSLSAYLTLLFIQKKIS